MSPEEKAQRCCLWRFRYLETRKQRQDHQGSRGEKQPAQEKKDQGSCASWKLRKESPKNEGDGFLETERKTRDLSVWTLVVSVGVGRNACVVMPSKYFYMSRAFKNFQGHRTLDTYLLSRVLHQPWKGGSERMSVDGSSRAKAHCVQMTLHK